jgi:hypothetical protein
VTIEATTPPGGQKVAEPPGAVPGIDLDKVSGLNGATATVVDMVVKQASLPVKK